LARTLRGVDVVISKLLVDIMALETSRAQIDKRSGETAKKRKAAPVVAATATVAAA